MSDIAPVSGVVCMRHAAAHGAIIAGPATCTGTGCTLRNQNCKQTSAMHMVEIGVRSTVVIGQRTCNCQGISCALHHLDPRHCNQRHRHSGSRHNDRPCHACTLLVLVYRYGHPQRLIINVPHFKVVRKHWVADVAGSCLAGTQLGEVVAGLRISSSQAVEGLVA